MTYKITMNELRTMQNTPYNNPEHANKAAYTFMERNMDTIIQSLDISIRIEELNLLDKI